MKITIQLLLNNKIRATVNGPHFTKPLSVIVGSKQWNQGRLLEYQRQILIKADATLTRAYSKLHDARQGFLKRNSLDKL